MELTSQAATGVHRRATSIVALVAASMLAGACANAPVASSAPAPSPSEPGAASPIVTGTTEVVDEAPTGAIEIMVFSDALRFEPANVTVSAGAVEFNIRNKGTGSVGDVAHNMQIGPDLPPTSAVVGSADVRPNQNAVFSVTGLAPGTYRFWCTVQGEVGPHYADGMVGSITVTP